MSMRPCLLALIPLVGCAKIVEPVSHGRYFIDNRHGSPLHVEVTVHNGGRVLTDTIPANGLAAFMDVTEGSGGHLLPSNFVTSLTITAPDSLGQSVELYSGVRNADWQVVHHSTEQQKLVLVVE